MDRTTWCLFEEPYWLDCVAPGQWDAVEVKTDGKLRGRLPYVIRRKYNQTYITNPPMTPTLGPWIGRDKTAKYEKTISDEHAILQQLIDQLPHASKTEIVCAPEFTNLMAFKWSQHELGVGYTYRIDDFSNIDALWSRLKGEVRRNCRRAEKLVKVSTEPDLKAVLYAVEKTYARQHRDAKRELDLIERIEDVMGRRDQRKMFIARDAQDRVVAANYCVFDDRHTFGLFSGADAEGRALGAQALLVWEVIKDTPRTSAIFDFEGSVIPSIEQFVRGFGGRLAPRFHASKRTAMFTMVDGLRGAMRNRGSWLARA
jgi:hypothetical protein